MPAPGAGSAGAVEGVPDGVGVPVVGGGGGGGDGYASRGSCDTPTSLAAGPREHTARATT